MALIDDRRKFLEERYGISGADFLLLKNSLNDLGRPYTDDDIDSVLAGLNVELAINQPKVELGGLANDFIETGIETNDSKMVLKGKAMKRKLMGINERERDGD